MTPKEVLYVEDALGHAQFLKTQCQDAVDALQDAELKRQADRDTDHDEKIAENQKHIANNTRVIALIQKTLSKHQHEINESKAARGISSDSRILSVISLIVSLVSMALVGYLFFH